MFRSFCKLLLSSVCLILTAGEFKTCLANPGEISGEIKISDALKKSLKKGGTVFILAKRPESGAKMNPPVAVLKVDNPTFPLKFTLTSKNVMLGSSEFKGPLEITARYSPSGDAMDKSGPQGTDESHKSVDVGQSGILIELKELKKN